MANGRAVFESLSNQSCTLIAEDLVSPLTVKVFGPTATEHSTDEYKECFKVVVPAKGEVHFINESGCHFYEYVIRVYHKGAEASAYTLVCIPAADPCKWKVQDIRESKELLPESGSAAVFQYRSERELKPASAATQCEQKGKAPAPAAVAPA